MAADAISNALDYSYLVRGSIQALVSGAPVGTLKVQVSNNAQDWEDVPSLTQAIAAAGNYVIRFCGMNERFLRVYYSRTSGDGTINIWVSGKST